MKTDSFWSHWPDYNISLYFENMFDAVRPTLVQRTFQVKVTLTEQADLWSTVLFGPRGMRYLALELGAFFGFIMMFVFILLAINSIGLRADLTDLIMSKFKSAKYKVEDVVSYEEFINMKHFIEKLKRNSKFKALLKEEGIDESSGDEDDEEKLRHSR